MPRPLSTAARRALSAQETDQVFLPILTIEHPQLAEPLRFVRDFGDLVSRGQTYVAFPFDIDLPDDAREGVPKVTLRIDNVDRRLVEAVRTLEGPPTVTLEVVLASSPDTVEVGPYPFTLRDVEYDRGVVEGTLVFEDLLNEPVPAESFTPSSHPGLF